MDKQTFLAHVSAAYDAASHRFNSAGISQTNQSAYFNQIAPDMIAGVDKLIDNMYPKVFKPVTREILDYMPTNVGNATPEMLKALADALFRESQSVVSGLPMIKAAGLSELRYAVYEMPFLFSRNGQPMPSGFVFMNDVLMYVWIKDGVQYFSPVMYAHMRLFVTVTNGASSYIPTTVTAEFVKNSIFTPDSVTTKGYIRSR